MSHNEPKTSTAPKSPSCCVFLFALVGVTLVLVGGMAFWAYSRLQQKTGARITSAAVPSILPEGVPVYPRFMLDESATHRHQELMVLADRQARETPSTREQTLIFVCPDSIEQTSRWYAERLVPQGWQAQSIPAEGMKGRRFRRGTTSLLLWQSPEAQRTGRMGLTVVRPFLPSPDTAQ